MLSLYLICKYDYQTLLSLICEYGTSQASFYHQTWRPPPPPPFPLPLQEEAGVLRLISVPCPASPPAPPPPPCLICFPAALALQGRPCVDTPPGGRQPHHLNLAARQLNFPACARERKESEGEKSPLPGSHLLPIRCPHPCSIPCNWLQDPGMFVRVGCTVRVCQNAPTLHFDDAAVGCNHPDFETSRWGRCFTAELCLLLYLVFCLLH